MLEDLEVHARGMHRRLKARFSPTQLFTITPVNEPTNTPAPTDPPANPPANTPAATSAREWTLTSLRACTRHGRVLCPC
ncbi:uncharacterized protein PHACADRAFT_264131 [Phanerochaete carnosa HHB-10118-sp]|uniref:Uncharacterized protein n=1 Tax=Phanerochaete carnosa (strain HHB-10118-sp) TaxID=650164 RepID=K5VHI5_PHACS|nr:uncharacterized protein PHACADRAFT_264131 [Phanerochaete carnosa HHB-10118-sp]EKM50703.1 hypothetical protein PHACADRAFT_264131 [Phanerochaete carnosa HHB-10118-sp]